MQRVDAGIAVRTENALSVTDNKRLLEIVVRSGIDYKLTTRRRDCHS
jgi:hypothetical protein